METTRANEGYRGEPVLYMALELSGRNWKVMFSDGERRREVTVAAGDRLALEHQMAQAKAKLKLALQAEVVSCYEAGRDGFWVHRWLKSVEVDNHVIDAASIEVPQRGKRVKTDRVDAHKLMDLLLRRCRGERGVWREVRVPSVEQEDERQLQRERQRLLKERTSASNRIGSLLATQGLSKVRLDARFEQSLGEFKRWDGQPLPTQLVGQLLRQWERYMLAGRHLAALQAQQNRRVRQGEAGDVLAQQVRQLMRLCSVGVQSAWTFSAEMFAWREIRNAREVGALAGLTPTPYASGDSQREQGISKAGNARVRVAGVELAWMWLRRQPDSELSRWYQERFGHTGSKRSRRIGIVALARRLLVALWRYLHSGVIPSGARLKTV